MLQNSLYTVLSRQPAAADGALFRLRLHAGHAIYQAHFPGRPVTPGACVIEMARELLETVTGQQLEISAIREAKFLSVISPQDHPDITCHLSRISHAGGQWSAQAAFSCGGKAMARVSMVCKPYTT